MKVDQKLSLILSVQMMIYIGNGPNTICRNTKTKTNVFQNIILINLLIRDIRPISHILKKTTIEMIKPRGDLLSTYAKFSEKLTVLSP